MEREEWGGKGKEKGETQGEGDRWIRHDRSFPGEDSEVKDCPLSDRGRNLFKKVNHDWNAGFALQVNTNTLTLKWTHTEEYSRKTLIFQPYNEAWKGQSQGIHKHTHTHTQPLMCRDTHDTHSHIDTCRHTHLHTDSHIKGLDWIGMPLKSHQWSLQGDWKSVTQVACHQ